MKPRTPSLPGHPAPLRAYLGHASSLLLGAVLGACSLVVDFTDCRDDLDCGTLSGAQWRCVDSRCVDPSTPTGTDTGAATEPASTTDAAATGASELTTESSDTGPATLTGEPTSTGPDSDSADTGTDTGAACTLHSECSARFGLTYMCIAGDCLNVISGECREFAWPTQGSHDDVVLLGSIIPVAPPYELATVPLKNGVQLAIEDFNRTTELPGGRRIAWLTCDDGGDSDAAVTAATHLSDVLGAPAIVGPVFGQQVLDVAAITAPAGVFLITPSASSKAITTLDDDGLVWRTVASDVFQANALADRVLALTPVAKRVVLLNKLDDHDAGIRADLVARLSQAFGANFKAYDYPDPVSATPDDIAAEYAAVLGFAWGTKGNRPDTIVIVGTGEVADFAARIMALWNADNPMAPAPRLIVSDAGVASMEGIVLAAASDLDKTALIANLEGVAPELRAPHDGDSFSLRYQARFNNAAPTLAAALAYDATLVALFAMAGVAPDDPITGAAIAGNIVRLVDPQGLKVSFDDVMGDDLLFIRSARDALVSGGGVDLSGLSSELDFDLERGELRTDGLGLGLVPKPDMPTVPVLTPRRRYVLDPAPAEDGHWIDLP